MRTMSEITVKIYDAASGSFVESYDIISLSFTKERYTPFTSARINLVCDKAVDDAYEVVITVNSKTIHRGIADKTVSRKLSDGLYHTNIYSRGYTAALGVNQPVPKINSGVNLNGILTANEITLPFVTCQDSTKTVNYVYVLDKDTLWDAVVAYSVKAYSSYPYIRGSNTIMVTPPDSPESFEYSDNVLELISGVNLTNLVSKISMKDYDGNYNSYELVNSYAVSRRVIRQTKINLDEQWLSEPDTALKKRIYYSNRSAKFKGVKLYGYNGEDLFDKFTVIDQNVKQIENRDIHKIEITADKRGVFTTLYSYYDSYSGDIVKEA